MKTACLSLLSRKLDRSVFGVGHEARPATTRPTLRWVGLYARLSPLLLFVVSPRATAASSLTFPVVDTGQNQSFNDRAAMDLPAEAEAYFGQDANYLTHAAAYRDNGDGTVTDLVTGLMWSQAVDPQKLTPAQAARAADKLTLAGHDDWRLPTIKELYSLVDFRGTTGNAPPETRDEVPASAVPFINTDFFDFRYGDVSQGERYIDAQWVSSTFYAGTVMNRDRAVFGVNFADGRIKGYGLRGPRREKTFYVRYVRGNPSYGENQLIGHDDGTVTDVATGLTWTRIDSDEALTWQDALAYAEQLDLGGHRDWRLPDAKELQSIVDYRRAPDVTQSAAIDPLFGLSQITNEAGQRDWPFYWTSTTLRDGPDSSQAIVICLGRALGMMHGRVLDVHGAGSQRSDSKLGYAMIGHGPQGDAQRGKNYVLCVRGGDVQMVQGGAVDAAVPETVQRADYPERIKVAGIGYAPESRAAMGRRPFWR